MTFPIRLLTLGYGAAMLAGTGIFLLSGCAVTAGLTCWLGGAALTLAFGLVPMLYRDDSEPLVSPNVVTEVLQREYAKWDADLAQDRQFAGGIAATGPTGNRNSAA